MKIKYRLLLMIVTAVMVMPGTVHAQFAPQTGEPNFRLVVVDDSGAALSHATTLIYKSNDPSAVVCRGYCAGWTIYLEPGVAYDVVVGTIRIINLKAETGKVLEKVMQWSPPEVGDDWNLLLRIVDEEGKDDGVWYTLYRADNPAEVYCFCVIDEVSRLKLPEGDYEVRLGYSDPQIEKGITIKRGERTEKTLVFKTLPVTAQPTNKDKEISEDAQRTRILDKILNKIDPSLGQKSITPLLGMFALMFLPLILFGIFWIWMLIDLIKRPIPNKGVWLALMLVLVWIVPFVGWIVPFIYCFGPRRLHRLQTSQITPPSSAPPQTPKGTIPPTILK